LYHLTNSEGFARDDDENIRRVNGVGLVFSPLVFLDNDILPFVDVCGMGVMTEAEGLNRERGNIVGAPISLSWAVIPFQRPIQSAGMGENENAWDCTI
jgi:hypothetical protein